MTKPFIDRTQPHVFIDWETLAVVPNAKVLSLGAAAIVPNESEPIVFYANIKDSIGATDITTIRWWLDQYKKCPALEEIMRNNRQKADNVLISFCLWLQKLEVPYYLWGNGADFDIALLNYHMATCPNLRLPQWHYTKTRCFRQLKSMYPQVKAPAFEGLKHHAGNDALHEAKWFMEIINFIDTGEL